MNSIPTQTVVISTYIINKIRWFKAGLTDGIETPFYRERYRKRKVNFRIARYATVSIGDSVFIIGGITHYPNGVTSSGESAHSAVLSNIAEYKNHNWKLAGNLAQGRYHHTAISFGSSIMVVGGAGGPRGLKTEIWDMNSLQSQIIDPPSMNIYDRMGVFSVDLGFCSKNWKCCDLANNFATFNLNKYKWIHDFATICMHATFNDRHWEILSCYFHSWDYFSEINVLLQMSLIRLIFRISNFDTWQAAGWQR